MPLSRLPGVSNFCSNWLSPFLSIVRILSSQAISFQILLYTLSHDFLGRPFFLFLVISISITSRNWELCLHAWHDHTIADGFELSYPQSSQQHPSYHEEHQSTPYQPVSPHTLSRSYDAPPQVTSPHPQQ